MSRESPPVGTMVFYETARRALRPAFVTHRWEGGSVSLFILSSLSMDFVAPHELDQVVEGETAGTWRRSGP